MNKITITLTQDQKLHLIQLVNNHLYDDNTTDKEVAFDIRLLKQLAQAKS